MRLTPPCACSCPTVTHGAAPLTCPTTARCCPGASQAQAKADAGTLRSRLSWRRAPPAQQHTTHLDSAHCVCCMHGYCASIGKACCDLLCCSTVTATNTGWRVLLLCGTSRHTCISSCCTAAVSTRMPARAWASKHSLPHTCVHSHLLVTQHSRGSILQAHVSLQIACMWSTTFLPRGHILLCKPQQLWRFCRPTSVLCHAIL